MKVDLKAKEAHDRAFNARLAYENNCMLKYDRPHRPSLPIPKGERMEDYAEQFVTSVKEMMDCELAVERYIEKL